MGSLLFCSNARNVVGSKDETLVSLFCSKFLILYENIVMWNICIFVLTFFDLWWELCFLYKQYIH